MKFLLAVACVLVVVSSAKAADYTVSFTDEEHAALERDAKHQGREVQSIVETACRNGVFPLVQTMRNEERRARQDAFDRLPLDKQDEVKHLLGVK